MRAASMRSRGTPCRPARKMSAPKPTQPHTVMATTAYSAWFGSAKNPNRGRPTLPNTELISP